MEDIFKKNQAQSTEEYIWRICSYKDSGYTAKTWGEIAAIINQQVSDQRKPLDESTYRKRFKRYKLESSNSTINATPIGIVADAQKTKIRQLDIRSSYLRALRRDARKDELLQIFERTIQRAQPVSYRRIDSNTSQDKMMYVMLSDIHYGLSFTSGYSDYNSSIATARTMDYADKIIKVAEKNGVKNWCHVSLMGDLISGGIHQSIRIQNQQDIVQQIIGVSELVSAFLEKLAGYFNKVTVTSVSGNHSRIQFDLGNSLRKERLDCLIPWYCKTKLSNYDNVMFEENEYDSTVSVCDVFGNTVVSVHGDLDPNLKTSAARLSDFIGKRIDFLLAGHLHVSELRYQDTVYIRNGAVVTGGDEYTTKKRLFAPATQTCMILSSNGLEVLYPIKLSGGQKWA